jgi:hypothetical protein
VTRAGELLRFYVGRAMRGACRGRLGRLGRVFGAIKCAAGLILANTHRRHATIYTTRQHTAPPKSRLKYVAQCTWSRSIVNLWFRRVMEAEVDHLGAQPGKAFACILPGCLPLIERTRIEMSENRVWWRMADHLHLLKRLPIPG